MYVLCFRLNNQKTVTRENQLVSGKRYALVARSQPSFFQWISQKDRNGAYLTASLCFPEQARASGLHSRISV
jgi:hypothetical protein